MNDFKDFGIAPVTKGFVGDKISISAILNMEIVVQEFKVGPSKFEGKEERLDLQELLIDEDSHEEWDDDPEAMIKSMMSLTSTQKSTILFHSFMHKYGTGSTTSKCKASFMLRQFATWLGVDIASIEKEQNAVADRRKQNADSRIKKLKEQKATKKKTATKKPKAKKK